VSETTTAGTKYIILRDIVPSVRRFLEYRRCGTWPPFEELPSQLWVGAVMRLPAVEPSKSPMDCVGSLDSLAYEGEIMK
jgi:hypothetical protein